MAASSKFTLVTVTNRASSEKTVALPVGGASRRARWILGQALGRMHQQILEHGRGRGFAADREIGAAGAFGGLFTLKAEHNEDRRLS